MTNPTLEHAARAAEETGTLLSHADPDVWYEHIARAVLMSVLDLDDFKLSRIAADAANDAAFDYNEYATERMMISAHRAVIHAILNDSSTQGEDQC